MQILEPFFGSGGPMWMGAPPQATAMMPPLSSNPQPLASTPFNMAPSFSTPTGYTTTGLPPTAFGHLTTVPPYAFQPILTAPALIAAVAARRGQPQGPTNDQELEDFVFDVLELLPGANDVEVRSDGGRVVLSGTVPHKRLKRDIGEIVWALGVVTDVLNNLAIATRRRTRPAIREAETQPTSPARKQA
jgi:hypothetical protein